ncbi:MAG: hypothetical protein U0R19_19085 [Bryobacteraceae bacterium]
MSWIMNRGTASWRLCRWSNGKGCDPAKGLSDPYQARQWIDQQRDPLLMSRLRRGMNVPAGQSPHMLSDDEVARTVAHEISWKRVHVCVKEAQLIAERTDGHSYAGASQEAAPPPRPANRAAPPPSNAPKTNDQPSFGKEADLVALAGVLTSAAESGTPFCEECAKAAAAGGK